MNDAPNAPESNAARQPAAAVKDYLLGLQSRIVAAIEAIDGERFKRDAWTKPAGEKLGGGGITCILEEGNLFERAGVGFSHVTGQTLPPSATAARPELAGRGFEAMGVSLVFHPRNPYVPTVHMNVRYFVARVPESSAGSAGAAQANGAPAEDVWWFGGGMDLTPHYGFEDDARHFHATCKAALEPFGPDLHPRFKRWCDEYFFLKHRGEARGIGGIFFDDFHEGDFERCFALQRSVGDQFLPAYLPIVERRKDNTWGERERQWQSVRRGRYVEFNLVFDRGTSFGLQSGGRTESILMSMPPLAQWRYDWQPPAGSAEAELQSRFLVPREWV